MLQITILKYVGLPLLAVAALSIAWYAAVSHGEDKQKVIDAQAQVTLQKKYDAELLVKTTLIDDISESWTQAVVNIASNTAYSIDRTHHDKKSINHNTTISNQFVRDSSFSGLPGSTSSIPPIEAETSALYESTGISNPYRVSDYILKLGADDESCVVQLNALIDQENIIEGTK